ncbi:MAG: YlzJ-like protein [Firmicutes bacterium]|nr:YlzJ-like protein [Bacillota bacterium]
MTFWTIVPMEIVMSGAEITPAYEEIEYSGVRVVVEKLSSAECRIVRVISTEPNDYLRPEVQPGKMLTYHVGDVV